LPVPHKIDAKCGDRFLPAAFSELIRTVEPGYLPALTNRPE
jgi:hypothetical protein